MLKRAANNLALALINGFVLYFFSERLFWSVWRPGDSWGDLVVTWLAYSTLAYLFLAAVWFFRVCNFWSVYLAGAIYGWLTEGGLIHTLYGTEPSAPFPISISITGLSWHALISVLVGWYATGRALTSRGPVSIVMISIGVGLFWGCWATFLWRETPPVITPVGGFFAYAAVMTLLLAAAWWLNFGSGVTRFRPGWTGVILSLLIIGTFYVQHVKTLGWRPVVILPILLLTALLPLLQHRKRQPPGASPFPDRLALPNLPCLALIPVAATMVYASARTIGLDRIPLTSIVYYWITGPAGFALLLISILRCVWRRPRADDAVPAAAGPPASR